MTRRILIVDDEPDIGFTFKLALEENGFKERVDVYNDPSLALNDFRADLYDLFVAGYRDAVNGRVDII